MNELAEAVPFLIAMGVLIFVSGFFSASEAAFFSLRARDRKVLSRAERPGNGSSSSYLTIPDRLLSAILFWNLVINVTYFAISSVVAIKLGDSQTLAALFAIGSLITIIFLSEMMPKTVAGANALQFFPAGLQHRYH